MRNFAKKVFLTGTLLLAATTFYAQAALPPLWESVREYKALLNSSKELGEHLKPGDMINDIKRDESGFVITATHTTIKVDVVYEPIDNAGPAKFHLVFHEADAPVAQ